MFLSNFLGVLSAFILIWGQTNLRIRNEGVLLAIKDTSTKSTHPPTHTHTHTHFQQHTLIHYRRSTSVLAADIRCV